MAVLKEAGLQRLITRIKTELNKKEPTINKQTGFNLTKTDSLENNSNKLFTAKGAYDLNNTITNAYKELMNNLKSTLETSISTKLTHGGYNGTAQDLKTLIDGKLNNPGYGGIHELGRYLDLHLAESTADYDTRISSNTDKSLMIQNSNGNLEIGPKNNSHCHIYSDRPSFYFNKEILINGNNVYHSGKKPTKTDVGLSNVNDWNASSDISANSTTEYATTNMVAKVRAEIPKKYVIPTHGSAVSYTRIGYMPANIGTGRGNFTAIIFGCSNYGEPSVPFIKLSFSSRRYSGSGDIPQDSVEAIIIGSGADISNISFITKLNNQNLELWIKTPAYAYPPVMVVFEENQFTRTLDSNTTTMLTGTITIHTVASVWHSKTFDPNSKLNASANAVSATKLLTPRSINGTNFDGTSNITTSIWGTSRTFTIGNTAKAVNGSANIGWSLSEIGAVNKSGDTMSGALTANGGINITTDTTINFSRNSDWFKLGFKNTGDSDTDSYGYIEMGDNGNEYFKIRCNSGGTITDLLTIKTDHLRYKNNPVYHVGYKPSKGDVGLGNVNNWGASSSIGANSTTEYATTNMVAQVRAEKLSNPGYGGVHELGRYLDLHLAGSGADYDARIWTDGGQKVCMSGILSIAGRAIIDASKFGDGTGQQPAISLAIGDNDTGFNWEGDGSLSYWANNTRRFYLNNVWHTGNFDPNSKANVNHSHGYMSDGGQYGTLKLNNWIRTVGNCGWYSESYGGGWYMTDGTWIRTYNNKPIHVAGADITCTNNIIAYYSDVRLKKNFKPVNNALKTIMSVNPYYYEQNDFAKELGYNEEGKIHIGFKAQEIEKILPQVVQEAPVNHRNDLSDETRAKIGDEPIKTIDYARITPLLWKAIQELTEKITRLELELLKNGGK